MLSGPDSLDCLGKSIAQHLESVGLMGSVPLSLGEKATSCAHSYSGHSPSYSEHGIPLLGHFVKLLGYFRAILLLCIVLERAIREMEAYDNVGEQFLSDMQFVNTFFQFVNIQSLNRCVMTRTYSNSIAYKSFTARNILCALPRHPFLPQSFGNH